MMWHLSSRHRHTRMARRAALLLTLCLGMMFGLPYGVAKARGQVPGVLRSLLAQSGWTLAISDNFSDPNNGILSKSSSDPTHYEVGYLNGEYRIAQIDPNYDKAPTVSLPGTFDDAMLSLDVRMVGDTAHRYIAVVCRRQSDGSEYEFSLDPAAGEAYLDRWDGDVEKHLTNRTASNAIHRDNQSNHIDLQCVGNTISGLVNGTRVVSVQDNLYSSGRWAIEASNYAENPLTVDARFANLAIYRPASAAAAPPPVAPTAPTNLRAAALDSTSIRLDWTNTATNAAEFQIYDGLTQTRIATAPAGATSFTLRNLTPGTPYCVYGYAYNQAGFSDATSQVCATTPQ